MSQSPPPRYRSGPNTKRRLLELNINDTYRQPILSQLAEARSMEAVAATQSIPLNGALPSVSIIAGDGHAIRAAYNRVSSEFFRVLGIPIGGGRVFTRQEAESASPVAVISRKTAAQLWPGQQALGQILRIMPDPRTASESSVRRFPAVRIIGVADDIVSCCLSIGLDPAVVYLPTTLAAPGTALMVRVHGNSEQTRHDIDTRLARISASALDQIHTMDAARAAGLFPFRVLAAVCTALGGPCNRSTPSSGWRARSRRSWPRRSRRMCQCDAPSQLNRRLLSDMTESEISHNNVQWQPKNQLQRQRPLAQPPWPLIWPRSRRKNER
jgi:hypothetical protein